jgi:hypothetical protein
MDWYPDADETLLFRTPAKFASGYAPGVSGARWFRDTQRNDMQHELAGWPAGPRYEVRSVGEQAAQRTGRALSIGIPAILNVVANAMGALGSPFGSGDSAGLSKPQEPENEVTDFPVLWAASSTVARTVPWQLDPGRRPDTYRTDLALTDRRLIFLGTTAGTLGRADVLWQIPRDGIADAQRMEYSEVGADVRLVFTDGSWIRLATGNPDHAAKLVQSLHGEGTVGMLRETDLTCGQRIRVSRFISDLPKNAEPPTFTVLPNRRCDLEGRTSPPQGGEPSDGEAPNPMWYPRRRNSPEYGSRRAR